MPGSEWVANIVLVRKKDGNLRYCVDYHGLNAVTQKRNYPLPRIDTCLESLGNNCLFTSLDMRSGYWQVPVKPEDRDKTCFVTRKGVFGFNVLPFGLCNAPATFQRLVDMALAGLTWEICLVYLDDLVVFSRTFEDHVVRLQAVFDRLRTANLKLKPSKCVLFAAKIKFLGSVISSERIALDPDKVAAVQGWPVPQNLTEARAFVALAGYYRRHIEGFSTIARPLHELTRKNMPFTWGPSQAEAFEKLKKRLTTAPVLAMPIDGAGYVLDTDANATAAGCVLQQWQGGDLKVIGYASKAFSPAEVRYCTTRRELAAIMYGLYQYKHLLLGRKFLLRTDHAALTYLRRTPELVGQSARYLDKLAEYDFDLQHRPGAQHQNADALSRRPCEREPEAPPCGQYKAMTTRPVDDRVRALHAEPPAKRCRRANRKSASVDDGLIDPQGRSLLSKEMLRERQMEDPVTGLVVRWLTTPEAATISELTSSAPEAQGLYAQRDSLQLVDGVLYRNYERPDTTLQFQQVVVPRSLRGEFLQNSHSGLINGHFGVEKTRERLRALAYWQGWNEDVRLFGANFAINTVMDREVSKG